jgi:cell shape-determining protein MreD
MWFVHWVVTTGFLVDLILTGLVGTAAFALAYLAFGLAPAERRELTALRARLRSRGELG